MLACGVPDIITPSRSFVKPPLNARIQGNNNKLPQTIQQTTNINANAKLCNAPQEAILAVSSSFRGLRLACITETSLVIFGGTNTATRLAHVELPPQLAVARQSPNGRDDDNHHTGVLPRVECCWKRSADALVICRPDTGAVGFFSIRQTEVPTVKLRLAEWSQDPAELLPQESALHVTYLGSIQGGSSGPGSVDGGARQHHQQHQQQQHQQQQQRRQYRCTTVTTSHRGAVLFGTRCGYLLSVSWQDRVVVGALSLQQFHPSLAAAQPAIHRPTESVATHAGSTAATAGEEGRDDDTPRDDASSPSPALVLRHLSAASASACLGFVCSNGTAGVVQLPPLSSPLWKSDASAGHDGSSSSGSCELWCVVIPSSRVVRVSLSPTRPLVALARDDARVDIFRFARPPPWTAARSSSRCCSTTTTQTPPLHHHPQRSNNNHHSGGGGGGGCETTESGSPPIVSEEGGANGISSSSGTGASSAIALDLISSLSLRSWDISPSACGAVTEMAWSWRPDDCLAVLYERIGHMVWTVDGACRLSSFAPSVIVEPTARERHNETAPPAAGSPSSHSSVEFSSMAWAGYGYQLVVARNCQSECRHGGTRSKVSAVAQDDDDCDGDGDDSTAGESTPLSASNSSSSGGKREVHEQVDGGGNNNNNGLGAAANDECDLKGTPHIVMYPIVKACESMSLRRNGPERMCLVGAKHVLLLSTPPWDNHELGWQTLEPPRVYVDQNGPLLSAAFSDDCSQLALAGKTGLALFSLQTRRWRLFGNVNHERAIACEGLFWWGNDVICVVNYVGSRVAEFNTAVPAGTRTGQPTPSDDDDHATAAAATAAAFHQTESHVPGTGGGSRDNNSAAAPGTGGQSSSASHETNNTSLPATPDTTTAGHVAEYTLMCYPRTHLDNHSLLFSIKLPSKPMCVDCHLNQRLLIIQFAHSVGIYHVNAQNLSRSHSFTLPREQDQSNVQASPSTRRVDSHGVPDTTNQSTQNEHEYFERDESQRTNNTAGPTPDGQAVRFNCALVKLIHLGRHRQRRHRAQMEPFKSLVLLPHGGTRVPGVPVKLPRCVVLDSVGDLSVLNTEDESLTRIQKNVRACWSFYWWHPTSAYLSSPPWPLSLNHVIWVVDHDSLRLWVPALDPEAQLLRSPGTWSMALDSEVCALGIHPHFNTLVGISQRRARAPGCGLVSLEVDTRVQPVVQSLLHWLVHACRDQMLPGLLAAARHAVPFLRPALELWLFEAVEHDYDAVRKARQQQQHLQVQQLQQQTQKRRSRLASAESTGSSASLARGDSSHLQLTAPAAATTRSGGGLSRVSSFSSQQHNMHSNNNGAHGVSNGTVTSTSTRACDGPTAAAFTDSDANNNNNNNNVTSCAMMSRTVLDALRRFDPLIHAEALLGCARKAEPSRTWTVLFRTPAELQRVLDWCLAHGRVRLAATALPLLDRIADAGTVVGAEGHRESTTQKWSETRVDGTRRVWRAAVAAKDASLMAQVRASADKWGFELDD